MLFGQTPLPAPDAGVPPGLFWGAVSGIITAAAAGVALIVREVRQTRKERRESDAATNKAKEEAAKEARADALRELAFYSEKLQKEFDEYKKSSRTEMDDHKREAKAELDDMKKENKKVRDTLHTLRETYHKEMMGLHEKNALCEKENAEIRGRHDVMVARLEGELKLVTNDLRRVQAAVHDSHPAVSVPAIIIAGYDGLIRDASPSCGPMFHWLPSELKGRHVEMIIPERLRADHYKKFKEVVDGRHKPDPGKPILTEALRRDGTEFPVTIHMSHWEGSTGVKYLTAEIRDRSPVDTNTTTKET